MSRRRFSGRRILSYAPPIGNSWPSGADGNLTVDGTYHALTAGSTYDYDTIRVINGGQLEIVGSSFAWTIIGAKALFEIDASSTFNLATISSIATGATITATAPDGTALSFTTGSQSDGGAGGESGQFVPGGTDPNSYGPGGGGGSLNIGQDAQSTYGGYGGAGESGAGYVDGGYGGDVIDHNGGDAPGAYGEGLPDQAWGPGGGAGFRGRHSHSVYIKCGILRFANAPSVIGAAWDGGIGGRGGDAYTDSDAFSGGGGGGGAGGNGPKIVVRYRSATYSLVGRFTYSEGAGGSGGLAGEPFGLLSSNYGTDGQSGANGTTGVLDIATY